MSTSNPYEPPQMPIEVVPLVSLTRVVAFYTGFGTLPIFLCGITSPYAGGDSAIMHALALFPLAIHLATWLCFRLRWRETPWFMGLFIAIPGSCLMATAVILVLCAVFQFDILQGDHAIWWSCRAVFAGFVAVAIELAVANQLLQRSSTRDVRIAATAGVLAVAVIGVLSPLLEPVVTFLAPLTWWGSRAIACRQCVWSNHCKEVDFVNSQVLYRGVSTKERRDAHGACWYCLQTL